MGGNRTMNTFSDQQRDFDSQQLAKYEHEMDLQEQSDEAHEKEIFTKLADLYIMTGAELANLSNEISIALENYAEDLVMKEFKKSEDSADFALPEDDDYYAEPPYYDRYG